MFTCFRCMETCFTTGDASLVDTAAAILINTLSEKSKHLKLLITFLCLLTLAEIIPDLNYLTIDSCLAFKRESFA